MKKVFVVRLMDRERLELDGLVRRGKASVLTLAALGFCSRRTRAKTALRRPMPRSRKP